MNKIKAILLEADAYHSDGKLKVPPLYNNSFLFVRPTETVNTPGELILELFREVFFAKRYETPREVKLFPDKEDIGKCEFVSNKNFLPYTTEEVAILEIFRGRELRKVSTYLPSYPTIARNSWKRKNAGRLIMNQFLCGAISQAVEKSDHTRKVQEVKEFISLLYDALMGTQKEEILYKLIERTFYHGIQKKEEILGKLEEALLEGKPEDDNNSNHSQPSHVYHLIKEYKEDDILPITIKEDTISILKLEAKIPRVEWLNLLTTYLRLVIPVWVLSQCRFSIIYHEMVFRVIDNDKLISEKEFYNKMCRRNEKIFSCTITNNDGATNLIRDYAKCRIELSILFFILGQFFEEKKMLSLDLDKINRQTISAYELLVFLKKERLNIIQKLEINSISIEQAIKREAETQDIWRDPLKTKGIYRSIDFLLNGVRQMNSSEYDEGAIMQKAKRKSFGYTVFPRPMLIKLFCYLSQSKKKNSQISYKDLMNHFSIYGIDLTSSDKSSQLLIDELLRMGYLNSSKDAGYSALIKRIYN